jgi:hypothetical protein
MSRVSNPQVSGDQGYPNAPSCQAQGTHPGQWDLVI